MQWGKPIYALNPISQSLKGCHSASSSVDLIDMGLVLPTKIAECFCFLCPSPQGSWWWDVLGYVPAGSVSSSSTLQIFWDTNHLRQLLCLPVYLLSFSLMSYNYIYKRMKSNTVHAQDVRWLCQFCASQKENQAACNFIWMKIHCISWCLWLLWTCTFCNQALHHGKARHAYQIRKGQNNSDLVFISMLKSKPVWS